TRRAPTVADSIDWFRQTPLRFEGDRLGASVAQRCLTPGGPSMKSLALVVLLSFSTVATAAPDAAGLIPGALPSMRLLVPSQTPPPDAVEDAPAYTRWYLWVSLGAGTMMTLATVAGLVFAGIVMSIRMLPIESASGGAR